MKRTHIILGILLIVTLLLPSGSLYAANEHIPGFIENMDELF